MQHRREADREQVDGKRPDDRPGPARARRRRCRRRSRRRCPIAVPRQARDQRGGESDQQRVAPAVEEPRRDVAALVVGTEEVVVRIPGRPDRRRRRGRARRSTPAIDRHPSCRSRSSCPFEVRAERIGVRDVVRVEGCREAGEHDRRRTRRASPSRPCCGTAGGARAPTGLLRSGARPRRQARRAAAASLR